MSDGVKPIIKHNQYEKIVDDILVLGSNAILRFNVILAKYSNRFGRVNYHQEFEYYNREAGTPTITMRRDFDFYFSIENIRTDSDVPIRQFIMITINDISGFQLFMQDVIRWFDDPAYDGLYVTDSNKKELVMTKQISPIFINLPPGNSYIMAEPMVYVNRYNSQSPGVRLYLSSETNYVEIPLNTIRGLKALLDHTDMYNCACSLINYIQRPDLGTNLVSYSNPKAYNIETSTPAQQSGRRIKPKSQQGLEDLEK